MEAIETLHSAQLGATDRARLHEIAAGAVVFPGDDLLFERCAALDAAVSEAIPALHQLLEEMSELSAEGASEPLIELADVATFALGGLGDV